MILAAANDPTHWGIWLLLLAGLALAPFVLTMVTSFLKLVIVGGLIRTGLGTPQIPPTIVITGLAIVLSAHVMWPVGERILQNYAADASSAAADELNILKRLGRSAYGPMHEFLDRHSRAENKEFFRRLRGQQCGREMVGPPAPGVMDSATARMVEDVTVLVPAFVLTELAEAFQLGVCVLIPFLIVDLLVSNLLLALGAQTMQPMSIALPLKLLLFVLVDGWKMILKSVIIGYA